MSTEHKRRFLVVHEAGLPDAETGFINRQIQTVLEPLGFVVVIAADTSNAAERLRCENYALLIADVLHVAICTNEMAQVLGALRKEPDRPVPGMLLIIRRWCDINVTPATTYLRTNPMSLITPFNPQELRSYVRRLLERPDLPRNVSPSD